MTTLLVFTCILAVVLELSLILTVIAVQLAVVLPQSLQTQFLSLS